MKYSDFERILSHQRMSRYLNACAGDTKKAMTLYRENLRLSQEMFIILSCFEVALRNAINTKLINEFGPDWLRDSIQKGGIFDAGQFRDTHQIIARAFNRLDSKGIYSHSKLLAEMEFGIWKYMFSNPQYRATNRVLLKIFPNKPTSTPTEQYNNTYIFNELDGLNTLRNRIAHHEPVCFMKNSESISTSYLLQQYQRVQKLFSWMGVDSFSMLYGLDHIQNVCNRINSLK